MSQPLIKGDHHTNPHYKREKSDSRQRPCSEHHDSSDIGSSRAILLDCVPSASLFPGEMLAQRSSNPFRPSLIDADTNNSNIYARIDPEHCSVPFRIGYGDWLFDQSHLHRPGLLPPTPQLIRPPSDTGKVECRLISQEPLALCQRSNTDSTSTAKSGPLEQLTAQVRDLSLETLSTPPTSPITPVPSLTNSYHSRSSFAISEGSPCQDLGSPMGYLESFMPHDSDSAMGVSKRMYEVNIGSSIRSINPPLSDPLLNQGDQLYWTPRRTNLSSGSKYLTPRLPNSIHGATTTQLPQGFEGEKEVSYIDWDDEDDRRCTYAPLRRIKKSFTDLRAAERFISEAKARKRMTSSQRKEIRLDNPDGQRREACEAYSVPGRHHRLTYTPQSRSVSEKTEKSLSQLSSKLRKRPSTNLRSSSPRRIPPRTETSDRKVRRGIENAKSDGTSTASPPDTGIPPTPPSTGKRKRANTMTSEVSREAQKKKVKLGVVGKLVARLLGSKKER